MGDADSAKIVYGEAGILPESVDDVMEWIVKAVGEWLGEK